MLVTFTKRSDALNQSFVFIPTETQNISKRLNSFMNVACKHVELSFDTQEEQLMLITLTMATFHLSFPLKPEN